jgi:hypothetical protein
MASLDQIYSVITRIRDDLHDIVRRSQISPTQVVIGEGLSDLSERLGLVMAGEFRTGNGKEPGFGFSGVRIGYPAFSYGGEDWHIAGVSNDTLQFGLRASDGVATAGSGVVILDDDGVSIETNSGSADSTSSYKFHDQNDVTMGGLYGIIGGSTVFQLVLQTLTIRDLQSVYVHCSALDTAITELLAQGSGGNDFAAIIRLTGTATGKIEMNPGALDVDTIIWGEGGEAIRVDASANQVLIYGVPLVGNDGWIPISVTWTRTGNHTFTVSGDVTASYRKGTKIRYKDGGSYEYGVIASSSHAAGTTTVTLITTTSYAMAAATITDKYLSYIENPEGFPHKFNYTPTVSALAGSITSTTINEANWRIQGDVAYVFVDVTITNNGTGSGAVVITHPLTIQDSILGSREFTTGFLCYAATQSGNLYVRKYDETYPGATGNRIKVNGWAGLS